jgi:hypothetical protein
MGNVPPYTGGAQPNRVDVKGTPKTEDGPRAVKPYAIIPPGADWLPPPIYKTDLWSAQQTFPL